VPQKNFFKDNFVLIVGLALPVLLIVGFMLASSLPQVLSDPPKHDLVFSTTDYPPNANNIPVSVRFIVDDGVLKAQYVRTAVAPNNYSYNSWKRLYLYEANRQKVRQLTFGFPADMDGITGTKEQIVEATKDMRLDTTLQSPDGYELSYDGYTRSGLLSVRLTTGDGNTYFSYGDVQFVGWVTASR
jgi:hypothetical protein